jgi:hypothetical protein
MANEKEEERDRKERDEREKVDKELRPQRNGGLLPLTHEQLRKLKKKA